MIQFCDRNADDIPSILEGQSSFEGQDSRTAERGPATKRARWAPAPAAPGTVKRTTHGAHMDPIRLLDRPGTEPGTSESARGDGAASSPPARVWDSIEAILRRDGLISS